MSETQYRVCLSVPLGKRDGVMLLHQVDSNITGWLDIMGRKTAFSGVCSPDGWLTFTGALQTLVSTIPYTATGTVNNAKLQLKLQTASGAYYLLSGEEFKPDDKIL